jgi:hypothetical protein
MGSGLGCYGIARPRGPGALPDSPELASLAGTAANAVRAGADTGRAAVRASRTVEALPGPSIAVFGC